MPIGKSDHPDVHRTARNVSGGNRRRPYPVHMRESACRARENLYAHRSALQYYDIHTVRQRVPATAKEGEQRQAASLSLPLFPELWKACDCGG